MLLGNYLTYTITVSNLGPATATGVVVVDTLPPAVNFISASPAERYTVAGQVVTFTNLGNLGSGAQTNRHDYRPAHRGGHPHRLRLLPLRHRRSLQGEQFGVSQDHRSVASSTVTLSVSPLDMSGDFLAGQHGELRPGEHDESDAAGGLDAGYESAAERGGRAEHGHCAY